MGKYQVSFIMSDEVSENVTFSHAGTKLNYFFEYTTTKLYKARASSKALGRASAGKGNQSLNFIFTVNQLWCKST